MHSTTFAKLKTYFLSVLKMSGRRGRPKQNITNINRINHPSNPVQPRLTLKKINTETQSVHELSDGEAENIASRGQLSQMHARQKPGPKPRTQNSSTDIGQLLQSIKEDTVATRNEIKSTRNELKTEIQQLASHTETKFKSIDRQLAKTSGDIKILFARMSNIEKGTSSTVNNGELNKQILLRNNISISGMPYDPNENLADIVDWVLDALGLPELKIGELVKVKRISNAKSKLIIAGFRDYETKLAVMQIKASKKISLSDIYELRVGEANPQIYINNHLTPFYGNLSYHGRNAISNGLIHSCWVSSRGFLVRLNGDSDPIVIDDVQHLDNFLKEHGRVVQRKRDRSYEMDPSPSTAHASKIKSNRRAQSQDAIVQLDTAAKALVISPPSGAALTAAGGIGGATEMEIEHDRISK